MTLAVYIVRFLTILLGAGAVWLTYSSARILDPVHPGVALASAALIAFNPQFLYLSGAVNNDVPAALMGAALLWVCIRMVETGPSTRLDITTGILLGLALLTKFNLLALFVPIQVAYILTAVKRRSLRGYVRSSVTVLAIATLISGWWYARNWHLYGDPTGMKQVNELWAGRSAGDNWWFVRQGIPYLWSSLWGRLGYGQIPFPQPYYQAILVFGAVALAGHLASGRTRVSSKVYMILISSLIAIVAVVLYYMLIQPAGAMGRFLFPGLPAMVILIALGLLRLFPERWVTTSGVVVSVGMAAVGIGGLVCVLIPAYARPRALTISELESISNRSEAQFGDVAQLVGYEVSPSMIEPGDTVEVTLYWHVIRRTEQNYAVFVHLLSEVGTMIAQRDTYPGLGHYATTVWQPGVTFADTYRVEVPETAYAPDLASIQVGLYLPEGVRLTTQDGIDVVELAGIEIASRAGEFPNPLDVNFGNQIRLLGYHLDQRVARPGDTIHLTLYWEARTSLETNYSVFAHIAGVENQVWGSDDGWPVDGNAPTSSWAPGKVVEDTRELTVGLTTPANFYNIEVGLYDPDVERLPIIAPDGHWVNNRLRLSTIRVEQ